MMRLDADRRCSHFTSCIAHAGGGIGVIGRMMPAESERAPPSGNSSMRHTLTGLRPASPTDASAHFACARDGGAHIRYFLASASGGAEIR